MEEFYLFCGITSEQKRHNFLLRYLSEEKRKKTTPNFYMMWLCKKEDRKTEGFVSFMGTATSLVVLGEAVVLSSTNATSVRVWASEKFSVQEQHPSSGGTGTKMSRKRAPGQQLVAQQAILPSLHHAAPAPTGCLKRSLALKGRKLAKNTS